MPQSAINKSTTPQPKKKRRAAGCLSVLLTCLALLLLAASVAFYLFRSTPEEWTTIDAKLSNMSDQEMEQISSSFEKLFINETQGDPNAPINAGTNIEAELAKVYEKTIVIKVIDANIWLAKGFPELLKNQNAELPSGISNPRVWITGDKLVLSMHAQIEGVSTIVSGYIDATIQDDGQLQLKVTELKTGKLPLPPGAVGDQFRKQAKKGKDEITQRIADAFEGTTLDPVWPHPADPDNRQVRLLGIQMFSDRLEIKIRNSPLK